MQTFLVNHSKNICLYVSFFSVINALFVIRIIANEILDFFMEDIMLVLVYD